MKDEKRANSIAKRMNRYWLRRMLLLMILIDAGLFLMLRQGWIQVNVDYA